MRSRRTGFIALLAAVELLILGMMFYVVGGNAGGAPFFSGVHRENFVAGPIAPMAAGPAPVVRIDDPDSGVGVTASSDGLVHVYDRTAFNGSFVFGNSPDVPKLSVTRTADGVSITRPSYGNGIHGVVFGFNDSTQHIDIEVPPGSHVIVGHCDSAELSGIKNGVEVQSQDGHIALQDIDGNVIAHSSDGHIDATRLHGDSIELTTQDGHLKLKDITANTLIATTDDDSVRGSGLHIAGPSPKATLSSQDGSVEVAGYFAPGGAYQVSSDDGHVNVGLDSGSGVTIDAQTADGSIGINGRDNDNDGDQNTQTLKVGDGSGTMRVASQDGSIHITTNGVQ